MIAYCRQDRCYDALFADMLIRVFTEPERAPRRQFGNDAVEMTQRAGDIIIEIDMPQLVEHLATYGKPSEGWDYFAE